MDCKPKIFKIVLIFLFLWLAAVDGPVNVSFAASTAELEESVANLETRIANLEKYFEQLNSNLDKFSQGVLSQIDIKVKAGSDKVIAINPVSKKFTKIETNAGMFLLAVNKFQRTDDGYLLLLNVGNPNTGKYTGARFKMSWGKKWDPTSVHKDYAAWRNNLTSGEYVYGGELPAGEWQEITINLTPPGSNKLEYLECEMEVETVELQKQ